MSTMNRKEAFILFDQWRSAMASVGPRSCASAVFVLLVLVPACDAPPQNGAARPNVLLYISDTLRADGLGCYGNPTVETPHLDRFASEGLLFERAFAPSSWTRASMASILTGTAPAVHGAEGRFDLLADSAVMLAETFANEGYRVGSITTNRNVGAFFGFDQGFQSGDFIELYEPSSAERVDVSELTTLADDVTRRATEWIEQSREPFCLVVHTIDPHSPYMPPAEWDRYGAGIESTVDGSQKSLSRLNTQRSQADEARVVSLYYGEIAFNDHAFGTLIDWLRDRALLDRTVVAFTSDHGEEFWERGERGHGKTLNEKALHVPLILRYPTSLKSGREPSIVSTLELLPTLLELARIEVPDAIEGRSLLRSREAEDPVLFSSCKLSNLDLQSARNQRWKLVFDAKTGKQKLFDLGSTDVEIGNVLNANREVGRELFTALTDSMKHAAERRVALHGTREVLRVEELPDELEQALQGLGYLGEDSVGTDSPANDD